MTHPDLIALLERLEKASEPSRILDADIWCLFEAGVAEDDILGVANRGATWEDFGAKRGDVGNPCSWIGDGFVVFRRDGEMQAFGSYPAYTASLDAALALCERVMPGWAWMLENEGYDKGVYQDGKAGAFLREPIMSMYHIRAFAATPALALLTALLKARLSAEEEKA